MPNQKNSGFSLMEVTIVVVIGGLLMAAFGSIIINSQQKAKISVTKDRLNAVDEALRAYALTNYRLPCVARRNAPADTANFAVELGNCGAANVATETSRVASFGGGSSRIRIGVVPIRTLNLPDSFSYDAWGGRFLYAVNEADTNTGTFGDRPNQSIEIVDINDNPVVSPSGSIRYLVLSHGGDKEGAFNAAGTAPIACQNALEKDGENCNDNFTFRTSTRVSEAVGLQNFDDFLSYKGNARVSEVPSNAVMAFNLPTCPPGWGPLPNSAGRTIIGAGTYNQATRPTSIPLATAYGGEAFALNGVGGSATMMGTSGATDEFKSLPPYIVLTYCLKL